ncbi:MAG: response regulator transcription factor [Anaerolineales bacterium]|nr:response regulator transcription factor [Anaerolineales bacterium]
MQKISLMLVDDHDVVRTGLKTLLEGYPDMEVVAESGSGRNLPEMVTEVCPDVVLMDITMPEVDGFEATRRLSAECPGAHVLVLTVHEDKEYFFAMLKAGASGYITKRAAPEELVAAIRSVAAGNVYLQPPLARWLLRDYRRLVSSEPSHTPGEEVEEGESLDVLSQREQEVLELVAEGFTSSEIGEKLTISPKTVARHRERIMNKLNLHSSTELVKFAIKTGLIDL